jgi:hypothetical protein
MTRTVSSSDTLLGARASLQEDRQLARGTATLQLFPSLRAISSPLPIGTVSIANRNRHREQLRVGLHPAEVVLQFVGVRRRVVGDQHPAGAQRRYHQLEVPQVAGPIGVEEDEVEWTW